CSDRVPRPRRPRLIVAVVARDRYREAGEIHLAGRSLLDQPRQRSHAHAVRGAPTRHTIYAPAGTDRVAVARLEVAATDAPTHRLRYVLRKRPSCGERYLAKDDSATAAGTASHATAISSSAARLSEGSMRTAAPAERSA